MQIFNFVAIVVVFLTMAASSPSRAQSPDNVIPIISKGKWVGSGKPGPMWSRAEHDNGIPILEYNLRIDSETGENILIISARAAAGAWSDALMVRPRVNLNGKLAGDIEKKSWQRVDDNLLGCTWRFLLPKKFNQFDVGLNWKATGDN